MEVRLQSSHDPWWCQVFCRFEVDTYGKPLPAVREVTFGPRITDPDKVEGVLKRAQLAILNPSVLDATKFVELTLPLEEGTLPLGSTEQLEFSPNLVCVDVSGPEVTDLAFVDLPVRGLIPRRLLSTRGANQALAGNREQQGAAHHRARQEPRTQAHSWKLHHPRRPHHRG